MQIILNAYSTDGTDWPYTSEFAICTRWFRRTSGKISASSIPFITDTVAMRDGNNVSEKV